ncbi:hypothetical protein, partial [Burkholderia sp.]|uniref:hypothetical protein n=1 Tax=Burkholderia sp. TaxID=36773 RepID=UPI00258A9B33
PAACRARFVECHCGDGKQNRSVLLSYYGVSCAAFGMRSRRDAPQAGRSGKRLPAVVVPAMRGVLQPSDMQCSLMA